MFVLRPAKRTARLAVVLLVPRETVAHGSFGFKAQAVSVVDFDKDGVFNVWEIDQDKNLKETVKD